MRNKFLTIIAALVVSMNFATGASASSVGHNEAPVVISDNFNTFQGRNILGNGWDELERKRSYIKIKSSKARLRGARKGKKGADAAIASAGRDMSNFTGFEVSFNWKAMKKNEKSDKIYVSYSTDPNASMKDTNAWTTLFEGGSAKVRKKGEKRSTESFSGVFDFEEGTDLSNVKFMIWTDVSEGKKGKKEGFFFDNFSVTGLPGGESFEPFFDGPTDGVQPSLLAAQAFDAPTPTPVPVPASLPLLLIGLGALRYTSKRRRNAA